MDNIIVNLYFRQLRFLRSEIAGSCGESLIPLGRAPCNLSLRGTQSQSAQYLASKVFVMVYDDEHENPVAVCTIIQSCWKKFSARNSDDNEDE